MIEPSSQDFGDCGWLRYEICIFEWELMLDSAALHHPDKLSADPEGLISDAHFVYLRLAQDTLLNPVQRFAYDRFGPDMLRWEHCASIRDYLMVGFRVYAPSYIMTVLITLLLGVMGYLNWGRYVRCLPYSFRQLKG